MLGELLDCIMQWRKMDTESIYTICHPGTIPHSLYNGIQGRLPLADLIKLYERDGEIEGLILAQPHYNGFDLFVKPGLGNEELKELVDISYQITRKHMDAMGRQYKAVISDIYELDSQRQGVFEELGFQKGENWMNFTLRDLSEAIPAPVLPDGFSIRPSTMDDYEQIAAVHSGAFSSNWKPEVYRDEVMKKPGYAPEREMLVIAPDGRFAAFCVYWLDAVNKLGFFEPVGTHRDFQRKGLGKALMSHTLCLMKEQVMQQALIGHETDNPASSNLYASLGFKLHRRVFSYSRM
jgi:ribosomal protein S18 acetylase RimI-like enzyme